MAHISSGTGKGGKSFQDRETAARLRALTMKECEKHLKKGKGRLYEQVLLKLAGAVLPRLNEHTGEDGDPIIAQIIGMKIVNESDNETN